MTLWQGDFTVPQSPRDTFLDLPGWHKGVAFINGFHLGRYWWAGPQQPPPPGRRSAPS
jgi:beta-galactosidase